MSLQITRIKIKRCLNVATLFAIIASVVIPANTALAAAYSPASLEDGINLTWQSQGVPPGTRGGRELIQVGYACLTRDRMGAGSPNLDASIHRYAIMLTPGSDHLSLKPINAVNVQFDHRDSRNPTAHAIEAIPEQLIWRIAPTDVSGLWFEGNASADGLGRACIDGGISGAVNYLEQTHQITVTDALD